MVSFPIAFFIGSLVTDVLYFVFDNDIWTTMGTALIGFGIVGALLAAVFGFVDYWTAPMPARTKQRATIHMLVNLAVVALYVVNFLLRRETPETPIGYVLSVIGVIGLGVAGWFGGSLVFEERVGSTSGSPPEPAAIRPSQDLPRTVPPERQPIRH